MKENLFEESLTLCWIQWSSFVLSRGIIQTAVGLCSKLSTRSGRVENEKRAT